MAINKVVYSNKTLIDLTGDTIIANKLFKGYTAHDCAGNKITGTYVEPTLPSGSLEITESGTYDVTNYEQVVVNVASNEPVEMPVVNTIGSGNTTTSKVAITEPGVYVLSCYAGNSSAAKRYCTEIIYIDDLSRDIYATSISYTSYPAVYYSASKKAIYSETAYNGTGFYINSCYQLYKL